MIIMKKYLLFLLLIAGGFTAMAQFNAEKDPFMTKPLTSENIKDVFVQTSGGSISVTGVDPSEARIEVYIRGNNGRNGNELSREEIQKRLDEKYELNVSAAGNKLTATAKVKERNMDWKKGLSISFRIFVPKNISTDLSTSGGSIALTNLSGNLEFSTSGGSLHIDNVSGKTNGQTSGGSIHVQNSRDDIDLTTSGGSIKAENCNGNMRLVTSGGSLSLYDLKGNIRASTSGGSIQGKNIEGELDSHTSGGSIELSDLACSLETSTSGGNISVSMRELGKFIKINNSAGSITLQLPKNKAVDLDLAGGKIKTDHLENFSGRMDEDEIKGKLNGGGIPVSVRANSGRIYLELK
jgi:DUF4097 and DUF4098 domain-containing protein YvlB